MIPECEKLEIMVVGAEAFTRALFQSAAQESGCFAEPMAVEDAFEALAMIWDRCEAGRLPDVIVADFELPAMNAIQLTHEIRRHVETRGLFLGILSATPTDLDRIAAETAGADYYENYTAATDDLIAKFQAIGRQACRLNTVSGFTGLGGE